MKELLKWGSPSCSEWLSITFITTFLENILQHNINRSEKLPQKSQEKHLPAAPVSFDRGKEQDGLFESLQPFPCDIK